MQDSTTIAVKSITGAPAQNDCDLFPELADTLFCWVERLYRVLADRQAGQVFFLSREGQPLKRMFDLYRDRAGGNIQANYLEVSRRSTLLPSLGPLEHESFDTLFRQYRRISLFEFLSSLGLEDQCEALANELGLDHNAALARLESFPESESFSRLRALPRFRRLYDARRLTQRDAFMRYLRDLAGGELPREFVMVDVGWKGTIQDNLYALLCRNGASAVRAVSGYYIGLVAEGAACPGNEKHGLLFSSVGARTPRFQVFNENRSLFEVLLAADHGSVVGYTVGPEGMGRPVRGHFEEEPMLSAAVYPVQRRLMARYLALVQAMPPSQGGAHTDFDAVADTHARMVFRPTVAERAWFSSVFHVENFGVFERSHFRGASSPSTFGERVRFLASVAQRRDLGALGFWPWCTLRERGGALPAAIYAAIRRRQR